MSTPAPRVFNLPCDDTGRFFFKVEFHPTEQSMHAAIGSLRGWIDPEDSEALAMCMRYVKERCDDQGNFRRTGELGTIFFVEGTATTEVVSHELTHAAIGWAKRCRVNPMKRPSRKGHYVAEHEERFARTFQILFSKFYELAPKALAEAA